jgi:multiple antibiotic resistance protein
MSFSQSFILTFVPLFIVVDALGNIPFIVTLTEGSTTRERYRVIHIATVTALVVGLVFLFFGQFILKVLGISVGAFSISGGIILLVLSIKYMTTGRFVEMVKEEMVAVVPIGTPLVVGPATITTLLILSQQYSIYIVLLSFILNILITWVVFMLSSQIIRVLGTGGLKAISKVFSLLLAAIAVSMVLHGLVTLDILKTG